MKAGVGITKYYICGFYTCCEESQRMSDASQEAAAHNNVVGNRLSMSVLVEDARVDLACHCYCGLGTFWCWCFDNHHVKLGLVFFDKVGSKRKNFGRDFNGTPKIFP